MRRGGAEREERERGVGCKMACNYARETHAIGRDIDRNNDSIQSALRN